MLRFARLQNGLHSCGLQGVPMVAGSPMPNDPSLICPSSGVDIQRIPGGGPMCAPLKSEEMTPPSKNRFSPAYPPSNQAPPPTHLFNEMMPPSSHGEPKSISLPPPLPLPQSMLHSPPMNGMGEEANFPPFQQLVSQRLLSSVLFMEHGAFQWMTIYLPAGS